MKDLLLALGAVLALLVAAHTFQIRTQSPETFLVTKITDGDTFQISTGEKVRLLGVDTPETVSPVVDVQCYGQEASAKTKQLLLQRQIRLESDKTQGDKDRYGRLLRYVYVGDNLINKTLIEEGYAREYTYDKKYKYQKRI